MMDSSSAPERTPNTEISPETLKISSIPSKMKTYLLHYHQNQIHSNMMPDTNNNKKSSMMPGQNGSGKTEDNPQVEQERKGTFVSGFDDIRPNENQDAPMNIPTSIIK
jgi:hypothetical protein